MKKTKRKSLAPEELDSLEAHLAGALRPVQPSRDLVLRLRGRIRMPERELIVMRLSEWRSLMFALGTVLSSMMLLMTVARAMYHLVGRRG